MRQRRLTRYAFPLALAGLLLPGVARAGGIAIVDTTRAAANSSEGRQAEKVLTDLQEKKRSEFQPKQDELKRKAEELESQRFVLSEEALQERQFDLVKMRNDLERQLDAAKEEFEIEQRKLMQPILKRIQSVVNEVAKDEGYDLVIEKTSPGVLFFSDGLDITDQVIERLNDGTR